MVNPKITKCFIQKTSKLIQLLHDTILEKSGGTKGLRDEGGLYNSIYKIMGYRFKNMHDPGLVGALVYEELARRHHFTDGNKRTAHASAKLILFSMGFHLKVNYKEATPFIIEIAKHNSKVTKEELKKWVAKHLRMISNNDIVKFLKTIIIEMVDGK